MDACILILLIILAIGIAIILYTLQFSSVPILASTAGLIGSTLNSESNPTITGGNDNELLISDTANIVLDGHNLIHSLAHRNKVSVHGHTFDDSLKQLSALVTSGLPNKLIHIVIKNPNDAILDKIKTTTNSKTSHTAYIKNISEISKEYPSITYHLAYHKEKAVNYTKGHTKDQPAHHLKGRDDFLAIYLAGKLPSGYIVSHDKFKDFNSFKHIKPFTHYTIINGKNTDKEKINPLSFINNIGIQKPDIGTHLTYEITDDKARHGKILVDKKGEKSILYLYI